MRKYRILLIEPGYPNKYPPLGLMKLGAYHGSHGRGDTVVFVKGRSASALDQAWDRVYVTTLFSFEWNRTAAAIDFAIEAAGNQSERVFVGGIAASLMYETFSTEPRWAGVRFIRGLLDGPPAQALHLSEGDCDFGAEDLTGPPIEEMIPDYSILDHIDYTYPVRDAYFGYASRGCVRKCAFCGVPKLEGGQREMPPLMSLITGVDQTHGQKKDLVLMDNNVTASARYKEIIAEIRDVGFQRGAKFTRDDGRVVKRRVDFNQGVDARILAKSPMFLRQMATICISPLRIAFDHIGVRKVYEKAVRMAADNNLTSLSNYMLYNFMDTPADLYSRMHLNISLNTELGIRIWSFPMRYQPVTLKDRSHVGKHWNQYALRSFQMMLQATHGVVSGNPSFFLRAYGATSREFERLLSLPHAFIFHREHYEYGRGSSIREEYDAARKHLSASQEQELFAILSRVGGKKKQYRALTSSRSIDGPIRKLLWFYGIDEREVPGEARRKVLPLFPQLNPDPVLPTQEEMVEDVGLLDHEGAMMNLQGRQHKEAIG